MIATYYKFGNNTVTIKNNQIANKKLKKLFRDKNLFFCEVCGSAYTTYAHRHKRRWYLDKPELLYDFNQVLLLCLNCHNKIEYNKDARDWLFNKLRPNET